MSSIQNGVDFNEDAIDTKVPKDFAYLASKGKLEVAKEKFGLDSPILTADSVVTTGGGTLLRKLKIWKMQGGYWSFKVEQRLQ